MIILPPCADVLLCVVRQKRKKPTPKDTLVPIDAKNGEGGRVRGGCAIIYATVAQVVATATTPWSVHGSSVRSLLILLSFDEIESIESSESYDL